MIWDQTFHLKHSPRNRVDNLIRLVSAASFHFGLRRSNIRTNRPLHTSRRVNIIGAKNLIQLAEHFGKSRGFRFDCTYECQETQQYFKVQTIRKLMLNVVFTSVVSTSAVISTENSDQLRNDQQGAHSDDGAEQQTTQVQSIRTVGTHTRSGVRISL